MKRSMSIPSNYNQSSYLLLGLEVVEEDGALLRLLTPVLDDDARAVDDLAGVTLTINLACGKGVSRDIPIMLQKMA